MGVVYVSSGGGGGGGEGEEDNSVDSTGLVVASTETS